MTQEEQKQQIFDLIKNVKEQIDQGLLTEEQIAKAWEDIRDLQTNFLIGELFEDDEDQ